MRRTLKILLATMLLVMVCGCGDIAAEPKMDDYIYAVIVYPDQSKKIEGAVSHYAILQSNIFELTINGVTYYCSANNCIIMKGKEILKGE